MEMQSLAAHGNAGVVFSLRVAFCCISPTPATSRVVTRLCPRATPGGGSRGLQAPRGCRGDAGAGTPPARGCHINRFPGGDPRCGCSIFGRRGSPDVSLPGWHQAPELLWAPSQPHIPLGCHRHLGGLWDPEPMAGALSIHISWAAGCCLSSFQGGERSLYPAAP